jgi:Cu2+-exporting ATPase
MNRSATNEETATRRANQWAEARFAAGIMAGLMVLAPYAAVIYPTRFDLPFYDPSVVALLESALGSIFATHFYLNLAVLSGFVLLFAGRPILDDAVAAIRELSPNRSLVVATVAIGLYAYSSLAAFPLAIDGGVYYDVVVALIVGTTIARHSGVDAPETAGEEVSDEHGAVAAGRGPVTDDAPE